jgi:Flp pilus assembly protein TadG
MEPIRQRTRAQAIVEFALAAILIFFLLSAAVDLGLIFFRHQGLYNASLEGAQYGSRFTKNYTGAELAAMSLIDRQRLGCLVQNPVSTQTYICLDEDEIRSRLINESGDGGGINSVNLKDLNLTL